MPKRKRDSFRSLTDSTRSGVVSVESISLKKLLSKDNQAATALLHSLEQQSFAVVELPSVDKEQLLVVMMSWRRFFEDKTTKEKMKYKHVTSSTAQQQRLYGYNRVNAAKEVFRIRRNADILLPDYPDKLGQASLHSLALLEQIAEVVLTLLRPYLHLPQGTWERETLRSSHCPFDVFFYNNDAKVDIPNLSPHVDPGILTVIPCALCPGLSIHDGKQWVSVEEHLTPGRHVVVFAGVHLQELSSGRFKKAYHAVSKGEEPRVSFAYELRPSNSRW